MKDISVPPLVTAQVGGNLSDLPVRNGASQPRKVAFCTPSSGTWTDITNEEFLADVRGLAKGLMASGIGAGDRVAIMSRTRYEWAAADFAIWMAGAVSVPIYRRVVRRAQALERLPESHEPARDHNWSARHTVRRG